MQITAFQMAERLLGLQEVAGDEDNGFVVWSHSLCGLGQSPDEVPWCSSWLNAIAFLLGLPRSASALARSWLIVGKEIELDQAKPGFDIVILKRGGGNQPGPDVLQAPGHVGFYAGHDNFFVDLLGGNQGDKVSVASFERSRLLSVRRLYTEAP